ncbi:MAG: hypothetical protein ACR2N3_13650, partial [Pyrinomonadaceae bacterium]
NVPAAFVFPLEVAIPTPTGSKPETLEIKNRVQSFTLQLDGTPSKVEFDKSEKIPLKVIRMLPAAVLHKPARAKQ